ncbi:MAG: alanine--tRNA ligase [Erysipelotrichaceae bacterium]|nr:alanine--tRNA ligase [Erysipelotrichaceae bacterium]
MKNLTGNQVRQMFLDYFASKGHMIEPGASLVPHNDPTLLWINAGVAALKKYFDGSEKPRCNRICNAQKSIRTNDIENVGKTARHHTFFEMLGNFSIGDYFKEEALQYAWEFLTSPEWIGFDKNRMYVTVYPDDEVAYNTWVNKCGIDPSHILKTPNNFWEIGEGPGGPDSEIFYDRGPEFDPEGLGERAFFEELENDRYIEVWNVVFSQYDCKPAELDRKDYKELPQKNIDTGMGLERLTCLIQGGETNFDTDLFLPVIRATEKLAKYPYDGEYKMAYRVIADHIRTVTFALADGANFSNEGRGYVLRRVLRRAVRFGIKLNIEGAFMYKLVEIVAENMKDFYPYVTEKVALISRLVKNEEDTFHSTLANGEKLLMNALDEAENKILDGTVMFKLYDTYGFPKELTAEIAEERGFTVDMDGFNAEMSKQRERARAAREDEQSMSSQSADLMDFEENSDFLGYETHSMDAKVLACFKNGVRVLSIEDEGDVILCQTAFYAESGGQIADTGVLYNDVMKAEVVDVKKAPHKQHLHHIKVNKGTVSEGDVLHGQIDSARRVRIMGNHSSLHLLQSALREIIGDHIHQAGSYAGDTYGRFDFTHFEKVTEEQLHQIEERVNQMIMESNPVVTQVLSIEDAKNTGAIALFDEKYGDSVRVVSMGNVSKEFCGGTHVSNTQEIGVFKIVSEESIGSGIRRMTTKTKLEAYHDFVERENTLRIISEMLKMNSILGVEEKVQGVIEDNAALRKEIARLNQKMMMLEADEMVHSAKNINGINVIIKKLENADSGSLKALAETLRNKCEDSFVLLANHAGEKVVFVAAASKAAIAKGIKAGDMVKLAASVCGGNGGGRPDLAQSGGKDASKIDEAIEQIESKL